MRKWIEMRRDERRKRWRERKQRGNVREEEGHDGKLAEEENWGMRKNDRKEGGGELENGRMKNDDTIGSWRMLRRKKKHKDNKNNNDEKISKKQQPQSTKLFSIFVTFLSFKFLG